MENNEVLSEVVRCFGDLINWSEPPESYLFKNPFFKQGCRTFIQWRSGNEKFPVHLRVFESLYQKGYEWGNLLEADIKKHPLFYADEKERLHEVNMIIIGFCFGQLYLENKLDKILKGFTLLAIDRELYLSKKGLLFEPHSENRQDDLALLKEQLALVKIIGIVNKNSSLIGDFFIRDKP